MLDDLMEGLPMIEKRSAEESLAELEEILRRYHLGLARSGTPGAITQEEALAALRKLGFTVGEGLRFLRPSRRE
jgi:hypothetical protein